MKNVDAVELLKGIQLTERKRRRFYTQEEIEFINMVKVPINNGNNLGTQTGKKLEAIYRKSQGG